MKKKEIIKSNEVFSDIINKGKKVSNKYFSIFFIDKEEKNNLFGIAVPTKIGNAVTRNNLKRKTRNIIDQTKNLFQKPRKYIIIIKDACLKDSFKQQLNEFVSLIGEINEE